MVLAKSKYLLTLCLHSAAPSGFYSGHAFLGSQETINIWTKKNKSDSFISIAGLSNPVMFITLDMFLLEKNPNIYVRKVHNSLQNEGWAQ